MQTKENMTLKFSSLQSIYFITFCAIVAYANSYLNWRGLSVRTIGIVLSISSAISVLTLPQVAKLIEKNIKITVRKVLLFSFFILTIFSSAVFISSIKYLPILYIILLTTIFNTQSLLYTYIFEYINNGVEVNFGVSRGFGSMAFAIFSFVLGYIGNKLGFQFLPLIIALFSIIIILLILKLKKIEIQKKEIEVKKTKILKKYPKLYIFLIGISFIYFSHGVLNTFLLQIVKNVNGTNISVGICLFIAAIVELPMMSAFQIIVNKIGLKKILIISSIMFVIKSLLTYISTSIVMIYFSYFTQIGGFALYLPATIFYINKLMNENDRVLGQAYLISFGTLGSIVGNFIIGNIIEIKGVSFSLLITTMFALVGAILMIKGINDKIN